MNLHLNTLFLELQDIYTAIYIFKVVDTEWDKRVNEKDVPDYSVVRTILYESIVYRVILGLSKIFANQREYSLRKATNQIEHRIEPTSAVEQIDCDEIAEWLSLVNKLYKSCFGKELPYKSQMPSKEDIIYTFFWR